MADVEITTIVQLLHPLDTNNALESLSQLSLTDNDLHRSVSPTNRKYKSPHQPNIAKHRDKRSRRRKKTYPNIPVLPAIGGIVLPSITSILAEHHRQQAIDSVSIAQSCTSSIDDGSLFEEEESIRSISPPRSPTPFRNAITTVEVAIERAKQKHQKLASRRKSATAYDTGAVLSFMRLERNSRKPDFSKFWNASWGKDGSKADDASLISSIDGPSSDVDGNNTPQTPNRFTLPNNQNQSQSSDSQRHHSPSPSISHKSQDARTLVATPSEDSILLLKKELADYLNNVKRAYPTKSQQRQEHHQKIQRVNQPQPQSPQRQSKKQVSYEFGTIGMDDDSVEGGSLGLAGYRDDGSVQSIQSLNSSFIPGYSNNHGSSLDGTEFSIIRRSPMSSSGRSISSRGSNSAKGLKR